MKRKEKRKMDNLVYVEKKQPSFKWNWGAFMMPIQFGIGNKAYMTLLMFVPVLCLIWPFVCGAQGEKWAYDSGCFANADEFYGAMKSWNRSGKVMFILIVVALALYFLVFASLIGLFFGALD
jgi:hypothetical protein